MKPARETKTTQNRNSLCLLPALLPGAAADARRVQLHFTRT